MTSTREAALDLLHRVEHALVVAVGAVDDEHVDAGVDERLGPVERLGARRRRRRRPGGGPARRRWPCGNSAALVMSLIVMRPRSLPLVVDDRQLLDAVLPQHRLGLLEGGADRRGDERRPAHDLGDRAVVAALGEAEVAVGEQPERGGPRRRRSARRRCGSGPSARGRRPRGRSGGRVTGSAIMPDWLRFTRSTSDDLVGDRQVAVHDADAAGPGQGDGEAGLGDGVHRRRDDRDGQLDARREPGRRSTRWPGRTFDSAGMSSTSSNVSPSLANFSG